MMRYDDMPDWKRTNYCGDLSVANVDQNVILYGWIHKHRDMGNLVFIDLRDRQGVVQVVVESED